MDAVKLGYKGCELYDENIPEEAPTYGLKLRASPIKSKRRLWEIEKHERKTLIKALQESKKSRKARAKLTLKNLANGQSRSNKAVLVDSEIGAVLMNIGEDHVVSPSLKHSSVNILIIYY